MDKENVRKRIPIGSFTPQYFKHHITVSQKNPDGDWGMSRPVAYYSIPDRLKMAWDVLTYKADALYW